ncbi:hypothetical protein NEOC84_000395|uniref:hypothetical protein n=1 Tax=Neochlamydia sp. AcF84 TaxID=2315858 RepID=UPI00140A9C5D|nr:hypothetical protein [Neochlamydia sp. AcF84]NGY94515.1 hypothetical protein [Neochlamydia sp. AcF84]
MTINQNCLTGQNDFYHTLVGKKQVKENTFKTEAALGYGKAALVSKLAKSSLDTPNASRQNKIKGKNWVQRLPATNGQMVEFTYGDKKEIVMAYILPGKNGKSIYIYPENLPKELKIIQSVETFFSFFKNVSVRIAELSKDEYKLYVSGKLLGGIVIGSEDTTSPNSYQKALGNFNTHLLDLANPLLLKDVKEKLAQISQDVIDSNEGIENHFSHLFLPQDTLHFLQQFSTQIIAWATSQPDQTSAIVQHVKNDLSQLAKQKREEEYPLWKPLVILFNLSQIRGLTNDKIKQIIHCINQGRVEALRNLVSSILESNHVEEDAINKQLRKEGKYKDIKTLLGQVIKKKPQPKDGIVTHWHKGCDFFVNKTFSLTDPNTEELYTGSIVKCLREESDHSLIFHLHDQSKVHITSNTYRVKIINEPRYKLWTALYNNLLSNQEIFKVECAPERRKEICLQPGFYFISSSKSENGGFFSSSSSISIDLRDALTKKQKYILRNYYDREDISKIEIFQWKGPRKGYIALKTYTSSELNRIYTVRRRIEKTISGINSTNADKQVRIKDEKDENKIKLFHFNQLKEQTEALRAELKGQSDLLERLIDNLVSHQLTKVDWHLLASQKQDLADRLTSLSKKYAQDLKITYRPEDILKKLVEEANYASLIEKEKSVVVSKTMELLQEAYQHIKKIKNKDAIFFVGNTGSGKSTAVSYFLGAEMESFPNRVGDKVVRVKKSEEAEETYPTIGQSLGESETLYTQSYALQGSSLMLADCPGFNDTRGEDYEICSNLSIDQAVQVAKQIKAIVLVVPIHAFLTDRANAIIDLIDTVKERFPHLFNSDKLEDNSRVYLLITKQAQVLPETVDKLVDGTRINELFKETQRKIESLLESQEAGEEIDDFELEGVQRRGNIWKVIKHMQENKQVDFIDVEDDCERTKILKKYERTSQRIAKDQYVPAMQGRDMRMKFGKCIEMSTDTWTHHIFTPYLQVLPQAIQSSKKEIKEREKQLEELQEEIKDRQASVEQLRVYQQTIEETIKHLERVQSNPTGLDAALQADLQRRVSECSSKHLSELEDMISNYKKKIQNANKHLQTMESKIESLSESIRTKEKLIAQLNKDMQNLSTGSRIEQLWKSASHPEENITLQSLKPGARENAFREIREFRTDEITKIREVKAKNYRGVMTHTVLIEKEFKLVPTDERMRKAFEQSGIGGNYIATVEGERYDLDLGRKASPNGKKIMYGFITHWRGDVLPWFKISHSIPNIDYNEATIINKEGQKKLLEQEVVRLRLDRDGGGTIIGKNQLKQQLENDIQQLETSLSHLHNEMKQSRDRLALAQIGEMLKAQKKELENTSKKIQKLEDHKEIEDKIKALEREKETEEKKLQATEKRKRNLAIIIQTHKETAKLLREFSALVVGQYMGREESNQRNEMVEACRKFIITYDSNIIKLEQQCHNDLSFAK